MGENNKKLVFACFTCKRDECLLPFHFAAIKSAVPDAIVCYVVDVADDSMQVPKCAEKIVTTWKRNGNLKGKAALTGILESFVRIAKHYESDYIVKIDSDVCFAGAEWLSGLLAGNFDFVGISPRGLYCASGACYALHSRVAQKALHYIRAFDYEDAADDRPEDETISMIAAIVSMPYRVCIFNHYYPETGSLISCVYKQEYANTEKPSLPIASAFIDCGSPAYIAQMKNVGTNACASKFVAMQHCSEVFTNIRIETTR